MSDRATSAVAIIATVTLACLLMLQFVGWQRAEQRADTSAAEVGQLRAELRHISNGCVTNAAGEGACRAGTFNVPSITTTVAP